MTPITPNLIENAAKAAGLSMNQLCHKAGVARSAFTRWKNGTSEPVVGTVNKMILVIRGEESTGSPS